MLVFVLVLVGSFGSIKTTSSVGVGAPAIVQQTIPIPHPPPPPPHPHLVSVVSSNPNPMPIPQPSIPTNIILSSRLNPRAPSFLVKVGPGGQQQPQQPPLSIGQQHPNVNVNSAFASTQSSQHQQQNAYMAQFKQSLGGQGQVQHPGQGYGQPQSRRLGSNWTGYSNGSLEDIPGFQTLSGLSGPGGMLDPATLIGGLDNIHDNQSE